MKLPYRWELVLWLAIAFFFNQADRQIFAVVMPLIRTDLGLSDLELGALVSIFSAALAIAVPFGGYAGDRYSRTKIVTGSFCCWSLSTLMTGFSTGFATLILFRSLATAVGEGVHAPAAYALISQHHEQSRGLAMALHQSSVYIGIIAAGIIGGYIGQYLGWRATFWFFGGAGLLFSLLVVSRVKPAPAASSQPVAPGLKSAVGALFRYRSAALLTVAFSSMVFVNTGCLTWTPTYLHEHFGLSVGDAGLVSMLFLHVAALPGVFLSGRLSDRLMVRKRASRAAMQAAGLLGLMPFLFLISETVNLGVAAVALAGIGFFRGVYEANIYAALHDVIPPRYHATGASAMICFAYLVGGLAPLALAAIKEYSGLASGYAWLALIPLPGAAAAMAAWRYTYGHDHAQAVAG